MGLEEIRRRLNFANATFGLYEKLQATVQDEKYQQRANAINLSKLVFKSDRETLTAAVEIIKSIKESKAYG